MVFARVAAECGGVADVLAALAGVHQGGGQALHPGQAQVVAVRGHGVHTHGRVAQQCAAVAGKALRVHGHQRVGVALARQFHGAQALVELRLHLGGKVVCAQRHQRGGIGRTGGNHHRAQRVAFGRVGQGQHGQGALVAKALVRHVAVGLCVAHAADDDGAAKVGHLGADAQLPARGREAAVGGHEQGRAQALGGRRHRTAAAVGWRWRQGRRRQVVQLGMGGQGRHPGHLRAAKDAHPRRARRHRVGAAAQGVIGHDEAQRLGRGACARGAGIQLQRAVLAQGAIVHLSLADSAHFAIGQLGPAAQPLQGGAAGVGEGDLAAVGCGRGQRGCGLLLDHCGSEAGLCQRNGQRQAGRACADDEDIAVGSRHGRTRGRSPGAGMGRRPLWARAGRQVLPCVNAGCCACYQLCSCLRLPYKREGPKTLGAPGPGTRERFQALAALRGARADFLRPVPAPSLPRRCSTQVTSSHRYDSSTL